MLYVVIGGIVVLSVILMIITIYNNRFKFTIIKIDEAENNMDILLEKKRDLLDRARSIIMKELKLKEFMDDIEFLKESKINNYEMNNSLKDLHNQLNKSLDENEKLFKSDPLISIIEDISCNEEAINGSIKFYNDNVVIFNQLISTFPSNIVAKIFHYMRKEFYNNEKKEMYEILNSK